MATSSAETDVMPQPSAPQPSTDKPASPGFGVRNDAGEQDILGRSPATADAANSVSPSDDTGTMQVIVFTSQKGGSGKTTMCGQLAVAAELGGAGPVALIDCDPQGSLSDWWNAREQTTPMFVRTSVDRLGEDLKLMHKQGINLVFVDTPPSVTETIREIVSHADMVVIPTRPSPHDLRAVGATLDIVDSNGKPLVFAVNGATKRARITSDTAVALSQHGTVAPVTVHHRNDFATSMIKGGAVMETNPSSKSAQEIIELWRYLYSRLRKVERQRAPQPVAATPAPSTKATATKATAAATPKEEAAAPTRAEPVSGKKFGASGSRPAGGFGRRPDD